MINLFKKIQKGGPRGTILHYIKNNQIVKNNSLMLMDAGCQYRDYSSDVNFILNNSSLNSLLNKYLPVR